MSLTKDERSIIAGVLLSAGVMGIGILQLYAALASLTIEGYLGTMIVGAMLFNGGLTGVCSLLSVWFNYRAIL